MRTTTKFYDDKNFKRGFSRSGFTIREAMILENYGRTMQLLLTGAMLAETEAEQRFMAHMLQQTTEASEFALCWLKYQNKINVKPKFYTLCGTQRSDNSDDSVDTAE